MTTDQDTTVTAPSVQKAELNSGQASNKSENRSTKSQKRSKQNGTSNKENTVPASYKGPNPTNIGVKGQDGKARRNKGAENEDPNLSESSDSETDESARRGFLRRVFGLPMIKQTVGTLRSYLDNNDASYARYAKFAVEKAEGVYHSVSHMTQPYQDKISAPLDIVDNFGCKSLDFVESKFPVVKQDPKDVYEQSRSALGSYKETLNKNFSNAINTPSKIMHKADSNLSSVIDNILHYVDDKHDLVDSDEKDKGEKNVGGYSSLGKITTLFKTLIHGLGSILASGSSKTKSLLSSMSKHEINFGSVSQNFSSTKDWLYAKFQNLYLSVRGLSASVFVNMKALINYIMESKISKVIAQKSRKLVEDFRINENFHHIKDFIVKKFSEFTTKPENDKPHSS